jgi:uncharacterized OB-fold protein
VTTSSPQYAKPLPIPDPVTRPYWESLRAHAMEIQRCAACGRYVFYPRAVCPHCFGGPLVWRRVSGRGTVYAFTVVHRAPAPEFQADAPYVVALVDLEEGVRLMATLVGVAADPVRIAIGTPVEVVYDDVTPEVTLPRFRPVQPAVVAAAGNAAESPAGRTA